MTPFWKVLVVGILGYQVILTMCILSIAGSGSDLGFYLFAVPVVIVAFAVIVHATTVKNPGTQSSD